MMGLGKLKEGKTLADVTTLLQRGTAGGGEVRPPPPRAGAEATHHHGRRPGREGEDEEEDPFAEIGDDVGAPGSFMGPGQKADITVPSFGEGTYAMVCFIPTEGGGHAPLRQGHGRPAHGGRRQGGRAHGRRHLQGRAGQGRRRTGHPHRRQARAQVRGRRRTPGSWSRAWPSSTRARRVADINRAFEAFEPRTTSSSRSTPPPLFPGQLSSASSTSTQPTRSTSASTSPPAPTASTPTTPTSTTPPIDPVEKTHLHRHLRRPRSCGHRRPAAQNVGRRLPSQGRWAAQWVRMASISPGSKWRS